MASSRGGARRGAGRSSRRDAAARRARILDAATELFAARGVEGTKTAAIARRAGVSAGTLFHHHPTKQALLAAIADRGAEAILAAAFAGADPDRDPPDLAATTRRLLAFARAHPDLYRVFRLGRSSAPDAEAGALPRAEERLVAATADALARWSARGLLRPMNPRIVAELVFAQFDSVVCHCVLMGHADDEEACTRELVRCLAGALVDPP